MAIDIGRTGSLGLAIEASPGSANITAAVFIPYTDISLRGHHEPLENISSRASRLMDSDSSLGRRWSEGDVSMLCDVVNSGYLFKLALGNEQLTTGSPDNHTFYTTVSGNAPKTATLIQSRGQTDVEQYVYSAVDELTLEVSDGLATLTASFQAKHPVAGTGQTETTTSGTVLGFKDYFVQFGNTLTAAGTAATTPLSEFSITFANNLEVIHRSGSDNVSAIRTKGFKCSGSYTLFFDSVTDRDAYYALTKRSMIMTASGNVSESLRIRIPEFRLDEAEVSTGLDDFYTVTANFTAEDDVDSGARLVDVRLQNEKASVY